MNRRRQADMATLAPAVAGDTATRSSRESDIPGGS